MFKTIYRTSVKLAEKLRLYNTRVDRYSRFINNYIRELGVLLDLGSGSGTFSKKLLGRAMLVIALDINFNSLRNISNPYIEKVCADAQVIPFKDKCIDTVISISLLEHLPCPEMCLHETNRVLKEKGHLIIQLPNLLWYIEPHTKFPLFILPNRLKELVRERLGYTYINFNSTIKRILNHTPKELKLVGKMNIYHKIKTPPWPPAWILVYEKNTLKRADTNIDI